MNVPTIAQQITTLQAPLIALQRHAGHLPPAQQSSMKDALQELNTALEELRKVAGTHEHERATLQAQTDLLDLVRDAIIVRDMEARIIFWNNGAEELYGWTKAEALGEISHTLLQTQFPHPLAEIEAELLRTGHWEGELSHTRKDGSSVIVKSGWTLQRDARDAPLLSLEINTDISERKRAEEALQASDRTFFQIQEALPVGVFVLEADGKPCYANAAARQLLGKGIAMEATADHLAEVYSAYIVGSEQPYPVERMPLVRALRGERSVVDDMEIRPPGKRIQLEVTGAPILDANGRLVYAVAVFTDITPRKQAEDALHSRLVEVQERTRELILLSEMTEMIHVCQSAEEAYAVITNSMEELFSKEAGILAVFKASQNLLETVAEWGTPPTEHVFSRDECWALRRGRPYQGDSAHARLRCPHLDRSFPGAYLCVPMIARGETLGVFHLSQVAPDGLTEAKARLAHTVAGQLGLVLSNLRLQETLRNQSIRDPLTGLFNRRYLEETLEREIHRAQRNDQPIGIMMLDIDHYKQFNDIFGHDAGDLLLRALSRLLQSQVRREDVVCRYGGEEFTVILPGASMEITRQRAEAFREAVKALHVEHANQPLGEITISVGVSIFPEHGRTTALLVKRADEALYRAKQGGRDRVVLA